MKNLPQNLLVRNNYKYVYYIFCKFIGVKLNFSKSCFGSKKVTFPMDFPKIVLGTQEPSPDNYEHNKKRIREIRPAVHA